MRRQYLLSLATVLALTAALSAQQPIRRVYQQPNTTPTPNGNLNLLEPEQPAQPVYRPSPYPAPVYRMNDVSSALKLNQEQITRLNTLTDRTQEHYREKYSDLDTVKEADRWARRQELNRQYSTDWAKGARDIFTPEQWNRYQQLNYQYGGFNSFYDPDVQKRLNLTPEQVKNLRESADWSNRQYDEIMRLGATDRDRAMERYRDYQKAHDERFNKFLTPEQQKTWREMTGERYTFQPMFPPSR
jgi:hypothetical protein